MPKARARVCVVVNVEVECLMCCGELLVKVAQDTYPFELAILSINVMSPSTIAKL